MGKSRKNCCVVGCHNTYSNAPPDTKFYSFPSKPWEIEVRNKWIAAVKREGWIPTKNSFVCSMHFIGNRKSMHPNNPAYVPSIFPEVYKRQEKKKSDVARFERVQRRSKNYMKEMEADEEMEPLDVEPAVEPLTPAKEDKCVAILHGTIKGDFVFSCCMMGNDAETQANIVSLSTLNPKPKTQEASTGVNLPKINGESDCVGFHGYGSLKSNEEGLVGLTGVSHEIFQILLNLLPKGDYRKMNRFNRLVLFLIKMKHGLTYAAVGTLFGVHRTTASIVFRRVLKTLARKLKNAIYWPSREAVFATMPEAFKVHYPNTRVIIDCTEMRCEMPMKVGDRNFMYSLYKSGYTVKFLIGITPNGLVSFISECYGGRASDAFITNDSGLLKLLEPGDIVLADKGFPDIKGSSLENIVMVIPPKVHEGHLDVNEIEETYNIASVRIHVERCIQRIKNFKILKFIPVRLFRHVNDIVHVACAIVNLQPPIIKQSKD